MHIYEKNSQIQQKSALALDAVLGEVCQDDI